MSRRLLLLLILIVVAGGAAYYVLKGSPKSTSGDRPGRSVAARVGDAKGKHRKTRVLSADAIARKQYAGQLIPLLDHARVIFDQAVSKAAAAPDLSSLGASCGGSGSSVSIQEGLVDGVPHPFLWYSPAGSLHHQIMGIYHQLEGGALACQTSASNGESDGTSSGVADMDAADHAMRHMDDYVRWLSWHG